MVPDLYVALNPQMILMGSETFWAIISALFCDYTVESLTVGHTKLQDRRVLGLNNQVPHTANEQLCEELVEVSRAP